MSHPDGDHRVVRDPGLQPERTALAWQRTGLSAAMVSLLTAIAGVRLGHPSIAILAAVVAAVTAIIAIIHFPRGVLDSRGRTRPWPVLVRVTTIVITTGFLGAFVGLLGLLNALQP